MKIIDLLMKPALKIIEKFFSGYFLSFSKREKWSSRVQALPDVAVFHVNVAIVMQGPIILKDKFTLETLQIYRKRLPEVQIILSTWDEYKTGQLQEFKDIGVKVIINKKPEYFGISNINLQIESTKNGIIQAKKHGANYCLRTRTDQRIYRHDFILFFFSLLKIFPINNNFNIKERLISVSLNTYKYRLYGITDMMMFGNIDDMILYWDADFDSRRWEDIKFEDTVEGWSKARVCEIFLSTEYLKKIGYRPQWSIQDSWKVFAKFFCIIDKSAIDMFWRKYDYWDEQRTYTNEERNLREEFTFSDEEIDHFLPDVLKIKA